MAWIRQEKSGRWAATVYTPAGRRRDTFDLKGQAEAWARSLETSVDVGDFIDPKAGKLTIGELWARYADTRRLSLAARRRDASHWRVHVEPVWAPVPCGSILKPDITAWVTSMERAGVGAATIEGAVGVLRSMLEIAVEARLIRSNPATNVKTPPRDAHVDRTLEDYEDGLLLGNIESLWPGRPDAALFTEVLLYCGLRWEEAAALDREHIDMRQRCILVARVVERDQTIRGYPKSAAGARVVPVDEVMWPHLRDRAMEVGPGGLIFPAPEGAVLNYNNWRRAVWNPGLLRRVPMTDDEVELYVAERRAAGRRSGWRPDYYREEPLLEEPKPTPHDLRHTYGTRLAEAGMPPHEIMALMGHSNLKSVQRYLHAREGRFDRARKAMYAARMASTVERFRVVREL